MELAEFIGEAKRSITKMTEEKIKLEEDEVATRSYLSPTQRLPAELLREIFLWHFEEHEACAWTLAAVYSSWRRLALRTPKLWAKVTVPHSSYHRIVVILLLPRHIAALTSSVAHVKPCVLSEPEGTHAFCSSFHLLFLATTFTQYYFYRSGYSQHQRLRQNFSDYGSNAQVIMLL